MKKNIIYFALFLFGIPITLAFYNNYKINKYKAIAKGVISSKTLGARSPEYYSATFVYKGSTYEASSRVIANCNSYYFEKKALGREVYIIFDSTNPELNILLNDKSTYQKYDLPYPNFLDSIKNCNE